jgi:hypothetical protein
LTQMKLQLAIFVAFSLSVPLFGASIAPQYSSSYSLTDLGSVPGVPAPYGGLTFEAGNPNVLLIGGSANNSGGVIDAITVTRDPVTGQITGFSGSATQFATAPNIDGGLTYGPGGDLFFTEYPNNAIGEIKPGDTSPDSTQSLSGVVGGSVGTIDFVPSGFTGAGNAIIGSYSAGTFCVSSLTPDGLGTYTFGSCTDSASTGGGPEGLVYVPAGSAGFSGQNALVSLYAGDEVEAYQVDSNGVPIPGSATTFISGLSGAEGAVLDPVTGDFLFSTFGGGNQVYEVSGFAVPPASTPEPSAFLLGGLALAGLAWRHRRSS